MSTMATAPSKPTAIRSGPYPPAPAHLAGRPQIVTLCGSTRFRAEFDHANRQLTLSGAIVLAPGVYGHAETVDTSAYKPDLDQLHRHKIALADYIVIINPDGYLGTSTRAEIAYAHELGKPIHYTHPAGT
jgi:hypothetical protein